MLKIYFYRINETELDTKRERALSVLPFWRVEKYTRMIPRSGKLLSLAAGLLLRHAMLDTTGIELKELEIAFNRHEKPYLTGRRLQGEGWSAGLIDGQLTGRSDELTARQFTGRIEEQIEGLAQFPERFQLYDLEPWHSRNLRVVSVKNFVILYIPNIETKVVNVYRIFYGKRDIATILSCLSK